MSFHCDRSLRLSHNNVTGVPFTSESPLELLPQFVHKRWSTAFPCNNPPLSGPRGPQIPRWSFTSTLVFSASLPGISSGISMSTAFTVIVALSKMQQLNSWKCQLKNNLVIGPQGTINNRVHSCHVQVFLLESFGSNWCFQEHCCCDLETEEEFKLYALQKNFCLYCS